MNSRRSPSSGSCVFGRLKAPSFLGSPCASEAHFRDSLPALLDTLGLAPLSAIPVVAFAKPFDLTYFQDSLPAPLDTMDAGALSPVPRAAAHKPFDRSQWWVWVAIVVVGGLAAFGALRALKRDTP